MTFIFQLGNRQALAQKATLPVENVLREALASTIIGKEVPKFTHSLSESFQSPGKFGNFVMRLSVIGEENKFSKSQMKQMGKTISEAINEQLEGVKDKNTEWKVTFVAAHQYETTQKGVSLPKKYDVVLEFKTIPKKTEFF